MIIALIIFILITILVYLIILGASICNKENEEEMENYENERKYK